MQLIDKKIQLAYNPTMVEGLKKGFDKEPSGYFNEYVRSTLQGEIESGISKSIAEKKDLKIETQTQGNSSINITKKGQPLAQILFGEKVLIKGNGVEKKFEYKDKGAILDALKNITK